MQIQSEKDNTKRNESDVSPIRANLEEPAQRQTQRRSESQEPLSKGITVGKVGGLGADIRITASGFEVQLAGITIPFSPEIISRFIDFEKKTVTITSLPKGIKIPGLNNFRIVISLNDSFQPTSSTFSADVDLPFLSGNVEGAIDTKGNASGEAKAKITKKVPALKEVEIDGKISRDQLQIEGNIEYDIPHVTGTFHLKYLRQSAKSGFTGDGNASYKGAKLSGLMNFALSETGISGDGTLTMELFKGLTGKATVTVNEKGKAQVQGRIDFPNTVELFPEKKYEKNFFDFSKKFPLWGVGIPVVDLYIGLIAEIHANAGFRAKFGPAVLRDISVTGEFGTDPETVTKMGLGGEIYIPAGAEIYLIFGGGIGLAAAIVDLTGGINLQGIAGLYTVLSARPNFKYENGKYTVAGEMELDGVAQLKAEIDAYAKVDVNLLIKTLTVWEKTWKLADWTWDAGLNMALKAKMAYTLGEEFKPEISFETGTIDPEKLTKDVMPESGTPVPATSKPAKPEKAGLTLEGTKDGGHTETIAKDVKPPKVGTPVPSTTKGQPKVLPEGKEGKKTDQPTQEKGKTLSPEEEKIRAAAESEIDKLVKQSHGKPFDKEALDEKILQLKKQYPFKELKIDGLEKDEWVLDYSLSPSKKVQVDAPKYHTGTENDRIPITWTKKYLNDYGSIFLKDPEGVLREFKPTRSPATPAFFRGDDGDVKLGVDVKYRTHSGMKIGPKKKPVRGDTVRKFSETLKKYDFDRTKSSPDEGITDMDHVLELQVGGEDQYENLWPLNFSENRKSGHDLYNLKVTYKNQKTGKVETSSIGSLEDGKYYFLIDEKGFKYE